MSSFRDQFTNKSALRRTAHGCTAMPALGVIISKGENYDLLPFDLCQCQLLGTFD